MNLRPYQLEARDAVNHHLASDDGHGVVSIPTAGGKTVIFATMIHEWLTTWPTSRVCILAHRQELLEQAENKIQKVWPGAPTGIWSAGLGRRDGDKNILIAGIQSIHRRACDFPKFDVIIVDEAHLVPNASDTMYRRFLKEAKLCNPNVRYIGFTATPYRLDGGPLCGDGKLFDSVIYEADIKSLIRDKHICRLRTKATDTVIDTSNVHVRKGNFVPGELEQCFNTGDIVKSAVAEIVAKGANRKAWLIFCCGVSHAAAVSNELALHGIEAPAVLGTTDSERRKRILTDFDGGKLRAVVNVNCLTTGLDITRIDLIAALRSTLSTSLWVQMVGRGFRLHPDKQDTLVLDFGNNCARHGPLDDLIIKQKGGDGTGEAPAKECPECEEMVAAAATECPCCGHIFPPRKLPHAPKAAEDRILTPDHPWNVLISHVVAEEHRRSGNPSSSATLQVTYFGQSDDSDGNIAKFDKHREWICLEHEGFARKKAEAWWKSRFNEPAPTTVHDALAKDLFLGSSIKNATESIRVRQKGKYTEIIGYKLAGVSGKSRLAH